MLTAARSRPALWLALIVAAGLLIALATAAPPAVTSRSNVGLDASVRIPQAADRCVQLAAVPEQTSAVRVRRVEGKPLRRSLGSCRHAAPR